MHEACERGRGDVAEIKRLLDDGVRVDCYNEVGATPLFTACYNGHVDAVRLLLDNGAKVDWAVEGGGWNGETPLFAACRNGHVDAARLLLDKGAKVDKRRNDWVTPLWIACFEGHVDAARLLLEKGAEVDRAAKGSITPLYAACENGHVDAARLLLDNGAEVDRTTNKGSTPLWIACSGGHVDAARLLLDNGAEIDRKDTYGKTPLDIAMSYRRVRRLVVRGRLVELVLHVQDLGALLLEQLRVPPGLGLPIPSIGHERRERFPRLAFRRHGAEQDAAELVDLRRRLEVARGRLDLSVAHRWCSIWRGAVFMSIGQQWRRLGCGLPGNRGAASHDDYRSQSVPLPLFAAWPRPKLRVYAPWLCSGSSAF